MKRLLFAALMLTAIGVSGQGRVDSSGVMTPEGGVPALGRYKVPKNSKISPKVSFDFGGPVQAAGPSKFTFTSPDGSKGQIELIRLNGKQNAIEVVWYSNRDKITFDDIFYRVP